MKSIYYPVLMNRQTEMNTLDWIMEYPDNSNVAPIVEVVKEFTHARKEKAGITFFDELESKAYKNRYFVDIIRREVTNGVQPKVTKSLARFDIEEVYKSYLLKISGLQNAIPVISMNLHSHFSKEKLGEILDSFNQDRPKAIRIHWDIQKTLDYTLFDLFEKNDYLIFDVGETGHHNQLHKNNFYKKFKTINMKKIVINSPRHSDFTHNDIIDGEEIEQIDNSLVYDYPSLGFDGFGDYAGVVSALPPSGGSVSPAAVLYNAKTNMFHGFHKKLGKILKNGEYVSERHSFDEYQSNLLPSINKSDYWKHIPDEHKKDCPGCKYILDSINGVETGRSPAKWKGVTINHYIFSFIE